MHGHFEVVGTRLTWVLFESSLLVQATGGVWVNTVLWYSSLTIIIRITSRSVIIIGSSFLEWIVVARWVGAV